MWERSSPYSLPQERLTFLQVHSIPEDELDFFYRTEAGLVAKDFYEQIDRFVEECYSGPVILTADLSGMGYDVQLILANSSHAQIQWLHQFGSREIRAENWRDEILRLQIEHFQPDVLLFTGVPLFDSAFVATLSWRPAVTAVWLTSDFAAELNWKKFDLVLANSDGVCDYVLQHGAPKAELLLPGFPTRLELSEEVGLERDLLYFGAWDRENPRTNFYLSQVASLTEDPDTLLSASFMLFGSRSDVPSELEANLIPATYGRRLYREIQKSLLVFDPADVTGVRSAESKKREPLNQGKAGRAALFQATGAGSLLLAENRSNLSDLFSVEDEIQLFTTLDDLHEKILFLKENEPSRAHIARKGQTRCRSSHSTRARAVRLHEILGGMIDRREMFDAVSTPPAGEAATNTTGRQPFFQDALVGPLGHAASLYIELTKGIDALHGGRHSEALEQFDLALRFNPLVDPKETAVIGKCLVLRKLGHLQDCRVLLEEFLKSSPQSTAAQDLLADIARELPLEAIREDRWEQEEAREPWDETPSNEERAGEASTTNDAPASPDQEPPSRLDVPLEEIPPPVMPSDEARVEALIDEALDLLKSNDQSDALRCLSEALRFRKVIRDLGYARALCFLKMGWIRDAYFALCEELRFVPENELAEKLCRKVTEQLPQPPAEDSEFLELFEQVRQHTLHTPDTLFALYRTARRICDDDVPGDFIECGVGVGGSLMLLAAVVKRHSKRARRVYAFDTFQGFPAAGPSDYYRELPADEAGYGEGAVIAPTDVMNRLAERLGTAHLIDPVEGLLEETLRERAPGFDIALAHVDCKLYSPVLTCLTTLFERLSRGGVLQIGGASTWSGTQLALEEFRKLQRVVLPFEPAGDDAQTFTK